MRTLPESTSVAANARRGEGRPESETDAEDQERFVCVVSRIHMVLNGISEFPDGL